MADKEASRFCACVELGDSVKIQTGYSTRLSPLKTSSRTFKLIVSCASKASTVSALSLRHGDKASGMNSEIRMRRAVQESSAMSTWLEILVEEPLYLLYAL